MKVVLDINVLISALLWHGPPHDLLKLIEKGAFTLCVTSDMLTDLMQVLARPKFFDRIEKLKTSCSELLIGVVDIAELYPDRKISRVVKNDPDDDNILSCARTSGAKHIVTGDPHLLDLKNWCGISILTPRRFLNHIK
jgi:putative PIN family toxin of toxin-antitoxin system